MELTELCERYDDRLRTEAFDGIDASANGLQVGREGELDHAAFAVDAARETIDRAAEAGADVLCVHHGLSWGGIERVTGRSYDRIAALIENDMALYVSHLPLDAHPDLGNAAGVADHLGLGSREPFGSLESETIGLAGRASSTYSAAGLEDRLSDLDTGGGAVRVLDFGPEDVEDVAIVTGSGADWLAEAVERGVDAFVTGEGKQKVYHEAREAGVTVVLAGHYATETFGVRSLRALADDWGLETTWIDAPTGM
ncbi:Nif3-like dinuclear metal center hexameric protein [Halalkalicoccus sp. NIPERK01]|uniref:Nif3-like dinuclear metal center hexameric protein n=1 Tax=Halalkalicoccus sp. NIPERK01 TaxID=3053469 RepID=UPI00256EFA6E|nr:Nif3-like dinuclear metal center hexameric protein [Halalkalicoccus sp. NIPERK01]MDL5362612.1 Nif3-like dinuclear metal center hexameric protein [Halalkalicoccus sp. NIPERK01]